MNYGLIAIAISLVCLLASLTMGLPVWVNGVGVIAGIAGLVLMGRGKSGGGA